MRVNTPGVRRSGVSLTPLSNRSWLGLQKERRPEEHGRRRRRAVGGGTVRRREGPVDRRSGDRDRAVERSRRESVDRHPGPNGTSSGPPARTTLYRPNGGVGTTVTSERSATLFTGAAYDRHAGPTLRFTGSAETCAAPPCGDFGTLRRAPAPATPRPPFRARTHHTNRPNPRRRVLAMHCLRRVRAWLVRRVAGLPAAAPGTAGMAQLQDVRFRSGAASQPRVTSVDASGNGAGTTSRTRHLRSAPPARLCSCRRARFHTKFKPRI